MERKDVGIHRPLLGEGRAIGQRATARMVEFCDTQPGDLPRVIDFSSVEPTPVPEQFDYYPDQN